MLTTNPFLEGFCDEIIKVASDTVKKGLIRRIAGGAGKAALGVGKLGLIGGAAAGGGALGGGALLAALANGGALNRIDGAKPPVEV